MCAGGIGGGVGGDWDAGESRGGKRTLTPFPPPVSLPPGFASFNWCHQRQPRHQSRITPAG
ncbi:hypothetical protein MTBLM5_30048 [Magnetospirillum sp. LM-5]|nr:hypothetical protein MTBLM5_30048 [Magnetospirillum sp. LM-5]